jgi:hypothetical protein
MPPQGEEPQRDRWGSLVRAPELDAPREILTRVKHVANFRLAKGVGAPF